MQVDGRSRGLANLAQANDVIDVRVGHHDGYNFQVVALDGNAVPQTKTVEMLRLALNGQKIAQDYETSWKFYKT